MEADLFPDMETDTGKRKVTKKREVKQKERPLANCSVCAWRKTCKLEFKDNMARIKCKGYSHFLAPIVAMRNERGEI